MCSKTSINTLNINNINIYIYIYIYIYSTYIPHFTFLEYFGLLCENFYSACGSIPAGEVFVL